MKRAAIAIAIFILAVSSVDAQIILRSGGYWTRDGSGNLVPLGGGTVDLTLSNLDLDNTTYANQKGIITKNGDRFVHDFNYGPNGTVTTDGYNAFIGVNAGNLTMGSTATEVYHSSYNSFIGVSSGYSNTTGYSNAFIGSSSGRSNTTGYSNSFIGDASGYSNTTGSNNSFIGGNSGRSNTTGANNSFIGSYSGYSNTTGTYNSFIGVSSGYSNTTGSYNAFIGVNAGYHNTTGYSNSVIGFNSGYNPANDIAQYRITTDTNAVLIGYGATKDSASQLDNIIAIGNSAQATKSNQAVIGNSSVVETVLRGAVLMTEMTAPSAPAANQVLIYAVDNGAGKTQLMALFPTGVAQQLAIEP